MSVGSNPTVTEKVSLLGHKHDDLYALINHSHSNYALTTHNHDLVYAAIVHTHDNYALTTHDHANQLIRPKFFVIPTTVPESTTFGNGETGLYLGTGNWSLPPTGSGGTSVVWTNPGTGYCGLKVGQGTTGAEGEKNVSLHGHVHSYDSLTGIPSAFTPATHTHNYLSTLTLGPTTKSVTNNALSFSVVEMIGYTPYNSTNPNNYISGITKAMVENVLIGSITSHTHSYLNNGGGIQSGSGEKYLHVASTNNWAFLRLTSNTEFWDLATRSSDLEFRYKGSNNTRVLISSGAYVSATGYIRYGSSDSYVLLGGGSHKLVSDFATNNIDNLITFSTRTIGDDTTQYKLGRLQGYLEIPEDQVYGLSFRAKYYSGTYGSQIKYATNGNEALIFANNYHHTSFIFKCGLLPSSFTSNWTAITNPSLQIKSQSVYINELIANAVTPAYNFLVNGTSRFKGNIEADATITASKLISSTLVIPQTTPSLSGSEIGLYLGDGTWGASPTSGGGTSVIWDASVIGQYAPLSVAGDKRNVSLYGHTHDYANKVKVGTTEYSVSSNMISLPAYPTTLPASDVYAWAKAATKPTYGISEITNLQTTLDGKQAVNANLTAIISLGAGAGILRSNGGNSWDLDASNYLTFVTKEMVEGVLTGGITTHNHDGRYLHSYGQASTGTTSEFGIDAFQTNYGTGNGYTLRGTWDYDRNRYITTDFGNIHLAGTSVLSFTSSSSYYSNLFITPLTSAGVINPLLGEMLFYTKNVEYDSGWTRVLTNRNYGNYALPLSGGVLTGYIAINTSTGGYIDFRRDGVNIGYIGQGTATDTDIRLYSYKSGHYISFPHTGGLKFYNGATNDIWHSGNFNPQYLYYSGSAAENSCVSPNSVMRWYLCATSAVGGDGYIQAFAWVGGLYQTQIFYDVDPTYNISIRHRDGDGNWNTWKRIWTEANFNPSDYLLRSGGTMTGQLLTTSVTETVYGGAIQIMERGSVGVSQSSWEYSPAISFHWYNRAVKRFGLRSDGQIAINDNPLWHSGNLVGTRSEHNHDSQHLKYNGKLNNDVLTVEEVTNQGCSQYGFGYSGTGRGFPTNGSFIAFGGLNSDGALSRYKTVLQAQYSYASELYFWTKNDDTGGTISPFRRVWHDGNMDAPNKSGTSYYQANTWIQFNGAYGLYCPTINYAEFNPNSSSDYGTWQVLGTRNGYRGITFGTNNDAMTIMDNGFSKGLFQSSQRWILRYNLTDGGITEIAPFKCDILSYNKITCNALDAAKLVIPTSAPTSPEAGKTYLYMSST